MSTAPNLNARAFETFNARFLTTSEVARTFIPPPQYEGLIDQNHTVLFGPRGSGKTTLLKMLQLSSLLAWQHDRAADVRASLPFHAIFLGTDVLWGSQLESRTSTLIDGEKAAQIRRTSFRLHLAIAFLNALNEARDPRLDADPGLRRFALHISPEMEAEIASTLAGYWKLTLATRSLLGVRTAVQTQLAELLGLVNRLRVEPSADLPDFAHMEPILSVTQAIDLVNQVVGQPDRRWAILCDELEIAPELIRHELFQLLRSSAQPVALKFSFFPYSSDVEVAALTGPSAPQAGHDYTPLDLTYGHREGAYDFCQALLNGMIANRGGPEHLDPQSVLGDGWFDGGRRHRRAQTSPYAPNGEFYRRAQQLMNVDKSFRAWMSKNKIDIRHIHEMSENEQAPFRKALPFILTRSEFRSRDGYRSRKSLSLYTGTRSMFSLSEGNPRVFINLMRPLVEEFLRKEGTVAAISQAASAETTIHRFRSSLSAIPSRKAGPIKSILHLIDIVGDFFRVEQLELEFRAEPPCTFIVDDEVSPDLLEMLGRALNSGGFVRMDAGHSAGLGVLHGARLRLAYTLAPEYKLPLAAGRAINLSTILGALEAGRRRNPDYQRQARLPFGVEAQ
jgi:hypothetical protein